MSKKGPKVGIQKWFAKESELNEPNIFWGEI